MTTDEYIKKGGTLNLLIGQDQNGHYYASLQTMTGLALTIDFCDSGSFGAVMKSLDHIMTDYDNLGDCFSSSLEGTDDVDDDSWDDLDNWVRQPGQMYTMDLERAKEDRTQSMTEHFNVDLLEDEEEL